MSCPTEPFIQSPSQILNHCQDPNCPGGNCPGCRNGNLWCEDPRCQPNCPDCTSPVNTTLSTTAIIAIILGSLLAIGILIYAIWRSNRPTKTTPIYSARPSASQITAASQPITPLQTTTIKPIPISSPTTTSSLSTLAPKGGVIGGSLLF